MNSEVRLALSTKAVNRKQEVSISRLKLYMLFCRDCFTSLLKYDSGGLLTADIPPGWVLQVKLNKITAVVKGTDR